MKQVQKCIVENCIPTQASCVKWNGGDIAYLGICDGEFLTNLIWEIVFKLQEIAGEDLSGFDMDSLTDVCNLKAPQEVSLLNILNLVKGNQLCLKDFCNNLSQQIAAFSNENRININLACYENFDNFGNSLSITRDELDQLVVTELCSMRERITSLEGKAINLQSQLDDLQVNATVEEPLFATCVDGSPKATSEQVKTLSQAFCDLKGSTGAASDISIALSHTPETFTQLFGALPGWNLQAGNWAQSYNNLLLAFGEVMNWVVMMQNTCCAASCEDVKLGFSATFSDDMESVILKFTSGAGTAIPSGFTDKGTTGTIKDADGNVESFTAVLVNNAEVEVPITGLNKNGDITISLSAVLGNGSLVCQKCIGKTVKISGCSYCELSATGDSTATALIVYEDPLTN